MIAYNYKLKFVPELTDDIADGKVSSAGEIIIQESQDRSIHKKLVYELPFLNSQGRYISLYSEGEFERSQESKFWAFIVKGVVAFFWYSGTLTIEYLPEENFTPELLKYWCLHIVLPVFFTVEERYDFLHAGAVEVDGKPILFVADSCGGKSTITDFFMQQGHTMISDDKVATLKKNGAVFLVPSHPHHRPYRGQEDLGFFVENFFTQPKQIHAIYGLEKAKENVVIKITELVGTEKFVTLRWSSEMNLYFLKPKKFACLGQIAKLVPVFKVRVPWHLDRLPEVYQAILKHSRDL